MSPSARQEHSAGIVLFHEPPPLNAEAASGRPAGRTFLILDYGRHWDFAKGHVEVGEDNLTAALRELKEETGISDARIVPGFEHPLTYFFRDQKKKALVRKTVTYFLAHTQTDQITLSEEHVGGKFLPLTEALARITFASSRQVLKQANEYLESR